MKKQQKKKKEKLPLMAHVLRGVQFSVDPVLHETLLFQLMACCLLTQFLFHDCGSKYIYIIVK